MRSPQATSENKPAPVESVAKAHPGLQYVLNNIAILALGKASKKSGTPDDQQFQLFDELPSGGKLGRTAADSGRRFITGDRVPLSWGHPVGAVFARVRSDGRLHRSTPARRTGLD